MTTAVSLPLLLGLLAQVPVPAPPTSGRSETMRELARGVRLEAGGAAVRMRGEPVYQFGDPSRSLSDGTVWAFGGPGRPSALLTISLEKKPDGRIQWLHEFTSLADGPLEASGAGAWSWRSAGAGVALAPVPKAPAPAGSEPQRLRQLRDLARRFDAHEFFEPGSTAPPQRYELRLLPQPVLRYRDPGAGLVDGAVFLIAYGQNPEVALVVEARRAGRAEPGWFYGLGRIAGARLRVNLDGREVADWPKIENAPKSAAYGIVVVPDGGAGR